MKRRRFLKTVGSATGAAAIGAVAVQDGTTQVTPKPKDNNGRTATLTHALEPAKLGPDSSTKTSTLRVRAPFWHPDGSPAEGGQDGTPADADGRRQVFQEEVVGKDDDGIMRSHPVEFEYKGFSKKWILGGKLDPNPTRNKSLTALVRELAVKIRKHNASLYRLRRIHFCNKYKDDAHKKHWPHGNPDGEDERDPTSGDVSKRVKEAESNWVRITDDLDGFIEKAKSGYPDKNPLILLAGVDVTAVNGYVVAIRVVVKQKSDNDYQTKQVGGSSSHVSLSSPFSSAADKQEG